ENYQLGFKYFSNQIFAFKDFRFFIVYGLVVKLKISAGQYYTLFKGQRHLCLKDTLDLKYLDILYNEILIKANDILDLAYPELIDEYPEGFVIDFFSLNALNSDGYNKYIKNVSQLSLIKDNFRVKSIKRSFAFFGGYSSGIRIIDGFNTNIFEGKYLANLH
ncbi:hypothetical protein GcM1_236092, partial [Golovinomyces cichoracearum]